MQYAYITLYVTKHSSQFTVHLSQDGFKSPLEVHMGCEETISLSVMTAAALRIYQVYVIPLQYANDVRTCDM